MKAEARKMKWGRMLLVALGVVAAAHVLQELGREFTEWARVVYDDHRTITEDRNLSGGRPMR
jgi:hypothetical protein